MSIWAKERGAKAQNSRSRKKRRTYKGLAGRTFRFVWRLAYCRRASRTTRARGSYIVLPPSGMIVSDCAQRTSAHDEMLGCSAQSRIDPELWQRPVSTEWWRRGESEF